MLKYLPAYSPDLHQRETIRTKRKVILRRSNARTTEESDAAIETALEAVSSHDA